MNGQLPHRHNDWAELDKLSLQLEETENFQTVADLFKHMGDTTRLKVFWLLCHCEECVINISALTQMSSPAVSHHLRLLKSCGLIVSHRIGKEVYYKASGAPKSKLLHQMIEQMMDITCPR